jgi:transposase-like protein
MKMHYLAVQSASKNWTMPIRDWKAALNRFIMDFEEQFSPHI